VAAVRGPAAVRAAVRAATRDAGRGPADSRSATEIPFWREGDCYGHAASSASPGGVNETRPSAGARTGMYSVFMEDWQASIPPERLTVLRSEDYFGHVAQVKPPPLAFLWRWLHLAEPTERDWRAAAAHAAEDGPLEAMTTDMRALVDTFYAPFNQRLAEQLEDDAFLWKS
jgi:hypothetical protein